MMRATPVVAGFLFLAGLSGCASTPEVRTLADQTGVFVTSLSEGTGEFVAAQNRLNSENEEHLQVLGAHAAAARSQVARQRLAWTGAGEATLISTQDAATRPTAEEVVARLSRRDLEPTRIAGEAEEGYAKAAKALAEVGAKPKLEAVLLGLVDYAADVRTSYESLHEEAVKASAEAADAAGDATEATTEAGAAVPESD